MTWSLTLREVHLWYLLHEQLSGYINSICESQFSAPLEWTIVSFLVVPLKDFSRAPGCCFWDPLPVFWSSFYLKWGMCLENDGCPSLQRYPAGRQEVRHRTLDRVLSSCQSSCAWGHPTHQSPCPLWSPCPDVETTFVLVGSKRAAPSAASFSQVAPMTTSLPYHWSLLTPKPVCPFRPSRFSGCSASSLFLATQSLAVTQQVLAGSSLRVRCCGGKNHHRGYSF